jgi:hypothetical protein
MQGLTDNGVGTVRSDINKEILPTEFIETVRRDLTDNDVIELSAFDSQHRLGDPGNERESSSAYPVGCGTNGRSVGSLIHREDLGLINPGDYHLESISARSYLFLEDPCAHLVQRKH